MNDVTHDQSIQKILANFFESQKNWKLTLLSQFHEIVGNNLKTHVSIIKIQETSIVIGVSNSCLLQELRILAPVLLDKINQSLDVPRLTTIQLKLRGHIQTESTFMTFNHDDVCTQFSTSLTQNDLEALKTVKDKELVHVLEAFRKRCHREAQWKKK